MQFIIMDRQLCMALIMVTAVFTLNFTVNYYTVDKISKRLNIQSSRNIADYSRVDNSAWDTILNTQNSSVDTSHLIRPPTLDKSTTFEIRSSNVSVRKVNETYNKPQTDHNDKAFVDSAKTEQNEQLKTDIDNGVHGEDVKSEVEQNGKIKTVLVDNIIGERRILETKQHEKMEMFKASSELQAKEAQGAEAYNKPQTNHNDKAFVESVMTEKHEQLKTNIDDKARSEDVKLGVEQNGKMKTSLDDNVRGERGETKQHEKVEVFKAPVMPQTKEAQDAEANKPVSHFRLVWDYARFNEEIQKCSGNCKFVSLPVRRGRMGNNMFQIASLIGTAKGMDNIPVIRPAFPLKRYFVFPNVMDLKVKNEKHCEEMGVGVFTRCSVPGKNVSLPGFRQSWKYFHHANDEVKNIFHFKERFLDRAKTYKNEISKGGYKIVGIHVRRGDITPQKRIQKGNAVVGMGFFKKAMNYFKEKYGRVVFIIISNDMGWCRQHLRGKNIVYSRFKDPGNDMALMTLCDNMILTYGTFGWWGAWLSGNPAVYFWEDPKPNSKADKNRRREDFYPPQWKPMTN